MSKNDRRWKPGMRPVLKIDLSTQNIALRVIAVGILIVIAAVALVTGLNILLNKEPGWQEIEVNSQTVHCGEDFKFTYDFSEYGGNSTAAYKQVVKLYSAAMEDCFRVFIGDSADETVHNVAYLNAHVNETVTVDPILYDALSLIKQYDNRNVYLAPVYVEYNRIFHAESEAEAASFDPAKNAELSAYIQELAGFANDPAMIDLEILENNQVRLHVSDAYLAAADGYELEGYLDFGWMTNAFICDYVAQLMLDNGFTCSNIVSIDGFTRNLDPRGTGYGFNLFNREDMGVQLPAALQYAEPTSFVSLRSYLMSERDAWNYRVYEDGSVSNMLIDPIDGMSKSALNNLVAYSGESGCAEILMQVAPLFISDHWEEEMAKALVSTDIYIIWFEGNVLKCTDASAVIALDQDGNYSMDIE